MKKIKPLSLIASFFLSMAGGSVHAQSVTIMEDGNSFLIEPQQTQSELKPGWKIIDVQLKSKIRRYLWGATAKQFSSNPQPRFIVDTDTLQLSNMVLIKLKGKKEYRRVPKPQIHDNKGTYVDFSTFSIDAYGGDLFLISPLHPLEPGEYIFTWTTLSPIGELSDWLVWPFSVKE